MERRKPLRSDPAKYREWQARSAKSMREKHLKKTPLKRSKIVNRKPRRNDAPWRAEVLSRYGLACVRCGDQAHVQADHIWPRSQGGPSDPRNGLPLCGEFSKNTPGGCHPMKTASRIVIEPAWLAPDQIEWLADVGWVWWDADGEPMGRGRKHFASQKAA